jgi:hypothetical protein
MTSPFSNITLGQSAVLAAVVGVIAPTIYRLWDRRCKVNSFIYNINRDPANVGPFLLSCSLAIYPLLGHQECFPRIMEHGGLSLMRKGW